VDCSKLLQPSLRPDVEANKGVSLGADLYIMKPFSTQSLVEAVDRFFGGGTASGVG
jgi:DNA-binding response OmpR family regulator